MEPVAEFRHSRVRAYLPPQSGRRAAGRVIAASYDIHAQIVETDFEAAYGYLSQRLRKRSLNYPLRFAKAKRLSILAADA